jgi:hypothetical protein
LQIDGNRGGRWTARTVWTALLLTLSLTAQAQDSDANGKSVPDNYYRAELVILERIVEPEAVNEKMANRKVEPTLESGEILQTVDRGGVTETTLDLAPRSDLHLNSAVQRLERSGRYRVLMAAGWYEAFPPGYEGTPLRVAVGDWLSGGDTREIEGNITIDRQRYLHVDVHLNHWQQAEGAMSAPMPTEQGQNEAATASQDNAGNPGPAANELTARSSELKAQPNGIEAQQAPAAAPLELLTWIRENRRMRSEEVHFLDSPTVGVLVFFKKIEASE